MSVARTAQVESLVTCHVCCSLSSSQTVHFQIRSKPGLGDVLSSTLLAVLQQGRLRCGSVYGIYSVSSLSLFKYHGFRSAPQTEALTVFLLPVVSS